ncbi:hypothetical protein PMAYCL1PPCAC_25882, partial [Pristionchus mayeri]
HRIQEAQQIVESIRTPQMTSRGRATVGEIRSTMGAKEIIRSHPRLFGSGSRSCRVCSNGHGLIRKHDLEMCRRCFREHAKDVGFKKVR